MSWCGDELGGGELAMRRNRQLPWQLQYELCTGEGRDIEGVVK